MSNIQRIASGSGFSLLLSKDGQIYSCGSNTNRGVLGIGVVSGIRNTPQQIFLKNVTYISAGRDHALALSTHNNIQQIWVWVSKNLLKI